MKKPPPTTTTATSASHMPPEYEWICSTNWVSAKEACFDYASLGIAEVPKIVQPGRSTARNTLKRCGLPLVSNLPGVKHALANFKEIEITVAELSPDTVLQFLTRNKDAIANVPSHVKDSKFQTAESVQSVLTYLMPNTFSENENAFESRLDKLVGLPLMMSEDGIVRAFRKHVLFASTFSRLAPSNSDKFLHQLLIDNFTNRSKAKSAFKAFAPRDLASMLPDEMDIDLYQSNVDVPFDIKVDQKNKREILRVAQDPNMSLAYINKFWEFLMRSKPEKLEIDRHLEPLNDWCLLPCRIGNHLFLTSIGNRKTVFNLDTDNSMKKVLNDLPIRQVSCHWCSSYITFGISIVSNTKEFYMSVISDIADRNAKHLLSALIRCEATAKKKIVEGSFQILDFFQNAIIHCRTDMPIEEVLSLPIFKHFDGGYRPIRNG